MNAVAQSDATGSERHVAVNARSPVAVDGARVAASPAPITSLQLGLGWFPESPGGLDRFYFELMDALPAAGVNCSGWVIGSSAASNDTQGRIRALASPSDSLPSRLLAARAAVRGSIREQHPDLVVSHFALYTFPALRSLQGLPLVVHFQGPWAEESRVEGAGRLSCLSKRLLERAVYRRADRLICLSEPFEQILIRDYAIAPDRIRVIPGGVDADRFAIAESRREARQRLVWPTDRPIVLCVRRLVRRMGLANLIQAADVLRQQVPDALVLIAGRGPLHDELVQQIAAANLSEHAKLLGYVSEEQLPVAYRAADVTVVPSIALEGFGLVAAESLAAGTPAIVSNVGGLPSVVKGLGDQWVLPGSSSNDLAEALSSFLRGRLTSISAARCAAHARANFDWSIIAGQIRNVYNEALGDAPRGG